MAIRALRAGRRRDRAQAPGDNDAAPLPPRLDELVRILSKVAVGDFSERPLVDENEPLAPLVAAIRFLIDDLERAHRERLLELERLREVDAMKTRFVNLAAHELRTPLTPIQVQLALLARAVGPDAGHRVDVVQRNVDRLQSLVGDLLLVAKLEDGGLPLEMAPTNVGDVVMEAVESFADVAAQLGIRLAIDAPRGAIVQADGARIQQVVYNLIANALRFSKRGGAVRVRVIIGRQKEDRVRVDVEDDGPGLAAEQMARLFLPFSQVHASAPARGPAGTAREGTGLGLYICKTIVERHDGLIWAESDGPGKGSRFSFTLPRGPPWPPAS